MTSRIAHLGWLPALLTCVVACNRPAPAETSTATAESPSTSATSSAASGPIDICSIVTPADAAALMGSLTPQPPAKTDHVGFGISACMYVGPALSGTGAQTIFARLTIQAGRGKDPADMLQDDVEKRHATTTLPGVGDSAKRNDTGSFVWTSKSGVTCTAEISNGLPPPLTPDTAAQGLGRLCQKVLAASTS